MPLPAVVTYKAFNLGDSFINKESLGIFIFERPNPKVIVTQEQILGLLSTAQHCCAINTNFTLDIIIHIK